MDDKHLNMGDAFVSLLVSALVVGVGVLEAVGGNAEVAAVAAALAVISVGLTLGAFFIALARTEDRP